MSLSLWKKRLIRLFCLPRCVGCGTYLSETEDVLCRTCLLSYRNMKYRNCSLCGERLSRCDCPNRFLETHFVHRLIKVTRYLPHRDDMVSNRLVYSLKRDNRSDVISFTAGEMADSIRSQVDGIGYYLVTNVPRRRSAIVKYGYDHAKDLAKSVAAYCGADYQDLFRSASRREQKQTHGVDRIRNAEVKLRTANLDLKGKRVLLVDDIVTTGASMGTCAVALRGMGAKEVIGVCLCIAYTDPYTPFAKSDF